MLAFTSFEDLTVPKPFRLQIRGPHPADDVACPRDRCVDS
jgi:hypothetical protein